MKSSQSQNIQMRAPIVTIMGHVDHGKTTLLDKIRGTNIVDKEFGGITQHVRAYQVIYDGKPITFIDTPGHEAFFNIRRRGSQINDILTLIVAADDGVMPQTKEVIDISKKSNLPLLVVINKIDLPGADIERVKRQLAENGILLEGYGGDIPFVTISAKQGINIDKYLEMINFIAEYYEMHKPRDLENKDSIGEGFVLESTVDKFRGPTATVIMTGGSIKTGSFVVCKSRFGKVRSLIDDTGKQTNQAFDSQPISIVGLDDVLDVGSKIYVFDSDKVAKKYLIDEKEEKVSPNTSTNSLNQKILAELFLEQQTKQEIKELNLIIIADTQSSVEAIKHSLSKIDVPGTKINIVLAKAGVLTQSDIDQAEIKKAFILTFNVGVDKKLQTVADNQGVFVREYKIIYELVDDVEAALISLIAPSFEEEIIGVATIKKIFILSDGEQICGCVVSEGKIIKGYQVYIQRGEERLAESKIVSLKQYKNEVKEVTSGHECGIQLGDKFDIEEGDQIVCYKKVKLGFGN